MTPKEKAKEICNKLFNGSPFDYNKEGCMKELRNSKRCALICVGEVISAFNFPKYNGDPETEINGDEIYWLDVKHELSLL